jgi:hypothetical protein
MIVPPLSVNRGIQMEEIACSCGRVVKRPRGTSTICGCGWEYEAIFPIVIEGNQEADDGGK